MSGRGYIKKRLAEMKLREEAEQLINQQNANTRDLICENLSPSLCNGVNKSPEIIAQSLINPTQTVPIDQPIKENGILHQTNSNHPVYNRFHESPIQPHAKSEMNQQQTIPTEPLIKENKTTHQTNPVLPVITNGFHKPSAQLQSHSMTNSPQEIPVDFEITENDPVIHRVPKISEKDFYKISKLESNYVQIDKKENIGIYEYDVDFNPPVDARAARFYLINSHKELFPVKTFDGNILFVPTMLKNNKTILIGKLKDESEVNITITYKRQKKLGECVHFYNTMLRTIMKYLGFIDFGKSCFDPSKKFILNSNSCRLEIWPGYVTNINVFENGLYLCCDVSHRVLRMETVLESIKALKSRNVNADIKQDIMTLLIGSTVLTRYSQKTYLIDDIDFSMTPKSTFKQSNTEISYVDYYKRMYDVEIKDLTQPMIITKPKKRNITNPNQDSNICCLVPELCCLTGLTELMRKDEKLMRELRHRLSSKPEMRQHALINLVKRINDHADASQILNKWGLKLHLTPVKLEGPVYRKEVITVGHNKRIQCKENMDWGSELVENAMLTVASLNDWAIFYRSNESQTVSTFCSELRYYGKRVGMEISNPILTVIPGNNAEAFVSILNHTIMSNSKLQLVVIIFPSRRNDIYNAIKRLCCAEIGIPSQVILSTSLKTPHKLRSVTQKIALQINCKLGGACWAIDIPLSKTMIVGIDVYHNKHNLVSSIVGFVASLDNKFTKWCTAVGKQNNTHQELLVTMKISFHKLLNKYQEINKFLPEKIIIYRDGVSDGDLKAVEEYELNNLEETFKFYFRDYTPKVTFIIVQKRINTRIYQFLDQRQSYVNPPAGTVVDNTITRRNFFDFFLVSQNVHQGTVSPTHYIVLKNGCNFTTENVQRLTFKLCHLYYNWCGTIKVPGPVQYAHKLAFLIGQHVQQMPNEKLSNTLHFL